MSGTAMDKVPHRPVLLAEVIEALAPRDGAIYVDGTFGAGGYSRALLEAAQCTVFAIDRVPEPMNSPAHSRHRHASRAHIGQGRFGDMLEQRRRAFHRLGIAVDRSSEEHASELQ